MNWVEYSNKCYLYMAYCLTKIPLFVPYGLELANTDVYFETDEEFKLKDVTCAYYNPIKNSIHINVEDKFLTENFTGKATIDFEKEFTAKLFFLLFHEVSHKFYNHYARKEGKANKVLWNMAADFEIHTMLKIYSEIFDPVATDSGRVSGWFNVISDFLFTSDTKYCYDAAYEKNIAEEIYHMLESSKEMSSESFDMNLGGSNSESSDDNDSSQSTTVTVTVSKYKTPSGKTFENVDISFPENVNKTEAEQKEADQAKQCTDLNKALNEMTIQDEVAKSKKLVGNQAAAANKFLKKLFKVKVDWQKILRNSLQNIFEKNDYCGWQSVRTSTFLLPNVPYLPDVVEDDSKYGTLIIARDESGSMTDEDLQKAISIITESKEHFKQIILIKHDTEISEMKVVDELDQESIDFICTRSAGGGTSHKEVFEYLANYKETDLTGPISCFIGISDLESDIEEYQDIVPRKIPMVWLVPGLKTIDNPFENIKGQKIPIE